MTITLTLEEVKNYVSAMENWQLSRAKIISERLREPPEHDSHLFYEINQLTAAWEKNNPMPTLLSSHLGTLVPKSVEQKPTMKQG